MSFEWGVTLAFFIPFWLACYGWGLLRAYRSRNKMRPTRLPIFITDIWAAVIGLLPGMWLLTWVVQHPSESNHSVDVVLAAMVLASQCMGIVAGRFYSEALPGEKLPRRLNQACWIWLGAFGFGIGYSFFVAFMFFPVALVGIIVVAFMGHFPLMWVAVLFVAIVLMILRRDARRKGAGGGDGVGSNGVMQ